MINYNEPLLSDSEFERMLDDFISSQMSEETDGLEDI